MIWICISQLLIESINTKMKKIKVVEATRKIIKKSKRTGKVERQLYDVDFNTNAKKHTKRKALKNKKVNNHNQQSNFDNQEPSSNEPRNLSSNNYQNNQPNYGQQNNQPNYGQQNNQPNYGQQNNQQNYGQQNNQNRYGNQPQNNQQQNPGQWNNRPQNNNGMYNPSMQNQNNNPNNRNNNSQYAFYRRQNIQPAECDLNIEIFPLYYTPVIRASTFRLAFSSNCLTKRDINFEVYYKDHNNINFNHNPTIVNLELWGNHYNITYSQPKVIDPYDVMRSLEYREANITNFLDKKTLKIDVMARNEIFLDPQIYNAFNKITMNSLRATDGVVKCELFEKKVHGWQLLKRIKDDAKKRQEENRKKLEEATKKAREDTEEFMKNQQKMLVESGRQLQETGFSFYKPPKFEDPESKQNRDPETYFPDEDLDKYLESDADKALKKPERIRTKDKNSVWGYATQEPSDYYDDKELELESEAPVKEFESHRKKLKILMKREYVEEYRIKCVIK